MTENPRYCQTCGSKKTLTGSTKNYKRFEPDDQYTTTTESNSTEDQTGSECITFLPKSRMERREYNISCQINHKLHTYPFCLVFIPFPLLS